MEKFPALVLCFLGFLGSRTGAQSGEMLTEVESLDGNQRDVAGPKDVTTAVPGFERVYAAQGRRMAMFNVATRDRQFVGEPTDFATDLNAVEIDEDRNLMFVLTGATNTKEPDLGGDSIIIQGKLQVYDVDTPSIPVLLQSINNITGSEIRVIPQDQKLLLIHTVPNPAWTPNPPPPPAVAPPKQLSRLTVYNYKDASSLTEMPTQHVDLPYDPYLLAETCQEDPLPRQVVSLVSAVVQVDNAQAPPIRRVFLGARIRHTRVATELQKGATGIVAVKLDPAYIAAPTFYLDISDVFDAYPCPVPEDPITHAVIRPENYAVRDLDLVKQNNQWLLCTVGAKQYGAKVFLLNGFEVVGFDRYVEATTFSGVQDDLVAVNVVGNSLAILGSQHSIAAETLNLGNSAVNGTLFGQGPPGDTVLMKEGSPSAPQTKLWSMTTGTGADYRFKIQNVTTLPPAPLPEAAYYGPGGTDAAVYIPEFNSVYATTFHGVVRYDVAPDAVPDYDSYSPALDGAEPLPVESMIAVKRGAPSGWQLFGNAAVGGFFQWSIHPVTHQPQLLGFFDGVAAGAWPSWASDPLVTKYGQDQEYGINPNNQHEILVIDHYNYDSKQIAINLYDLTTGTWGTPLVGPSAVKATSWEVTLDGKWVFVGGEGGFFVAEIVGGSGPSAFALRSTTLSNNVGGYSFAKVRGIQAVGNRLFVSFSDDVNRFALAKYSFDPVSGAVGATPLSVLFDGAGTQPDNFLGIFISGAFRLHKFTHGNETQLFSGTENGFVLQLSYFADVDSNLITNSPLRYWHNLSFYNEIDCQITNLAAPGLPPDLRLTLAKWTETFAVVKPFPFHQ